MNLLSLKTSLIVIVPDWSGDVDEEDDSLPGVHGDRPRPAVLSAHDGEVGILLGGPFTFDVHKQFCLEYLSPLSANSRNLAYYCMSYGLPPADVMCESSLVLLALHDGVAWQEFGR